MKAMTGFSPSCMGLCCLSLILLSMVGTARADSFLVLGGHMYGVTPDLKPAPGFLALVDSLPPRNPDAYLAGGDCTFSGAAAEWDSLEQCYAPNWNFPFIPVLGNHDASDLGEWYARWGDDTWRQDFGSTRVLFMWSSQQPNGNMGPTQLQFIRDELALAAADSSVTDVLLFQHHLAWVKTHARFEVIRKLGNAWYDEFSGRGYDVNEFFDELWPYITELAQHKPVTFYCGDTGYTDLQPGIFYDQFQGVTLIATGFHAYGYPGGDSVVFYRSVGGEVDLELFSPWGTDLGQIEDYDLNYWEARNAELPDPSPAAQSPPEPAFLTAVPMGNFQMGDHYNPRIGTYRESTGYSVSLTPYAMAVTEVTVAEYLAFLNAVGENSYEGIECVDLDDEQSQIEEVAGVFSAKSPHQYQEPVVEVTWYGALAYCNWLSQRDGLDPAYVGTVRQERVNGWRLPTDAEFEYAMRGEFGTNPGTSGYKRFSWGDNSEDHVHDYANYHGTGGRDVWEGLAPVGSFPPNLHGLRDMAGNAFEWVEDPWTWSSELSGLVDNPVAQGSWGYDQYRTIRGGGYNFDWAGCRNGYRGAELREKSQSYIGFRIARAGTDVVTASPPGESKISVVSLRAPSPNPLNFLTTVEYEMNRSGIRFRIDVYDLRGRHVRELASGVSSPGEFRVTWDTRDSEGARVSSGVYLISLRSAEGSATRRLSVIR